MLRQCSEYGLVAMLRVSTEDTIRQLFLTVRNSEAVLEMTGLFNSFSRLCVSPPSHIELMNYHKHTISFFLLLL